MIFMENIKTTNEHRFILLLSLSKLKFFYVPQPSPPLLSLGFLAFWVQICVFFFTSFFICMHFFYFGFLFFTACSLFLLKLWRYCDSFVFWFFVFPVLWHVIFLFRFFVFHYMFIVSSKAVKVLWFFCISVFCFSRALACDSFVRMVTLKSWEGIWRNLTCCNSWRNLTCWGNPLQGNRTLSSKPVLLHPLHSL